MNTVKTVIDGLHRDTQNRALVSVDVNAFNAYKKQRGQQMTLDLLAKQVQELRAELNVLKQTVNNKIG